MDRDRILQILKSKGSFSVSLRWRDDKLRARCYKMRKEGLITGGYKIIHGTKVFYLKETT